MKKNNKGFTLIELLATIIVLSIVLGLTIYIALNAISKAKEKSYQVTINNIEKEAANYLLEMKDKLFYVSQPDNEFIEYQCITVQNLLDLGYFKNDIIGKSKVSSNKTVAKDDYIYVERDANSKAITKNIYAGVDSDFVKNLCNMSIIAKGNIRFVSEPHFDNWSQVKMVTVKYTVNNVLEGDMDNIKYTYQFEDDLGNAISETVDCVSGCDDKSDTKVFKVSKPGEIIHGYIKNNNDDITDSKRLITNIDIVKPQISLINSDEKRIRYGHANIDIKVTDGESGINKNSFKIDDLVIKIGDYIVSNATLTEKKCTTNNSECIYELSVDDSTHIGELILTVKKDGVLDNAKNGNDEKTLDTNITFSNIYTITADGNGGAINETSDWNIADDKKTATKKITYNTAISTLPDATRTGYIFDGWYTAISDGTKVNESNKITTNQTIYAHWTAKTIEVTFIRNNTSSDNTNLKRTYTYGNSYNSETGTGNRFGYKLDGTVEWNQNGPWNRSGYTLLGWNKDRTALEKEMNPNNKVTNAWINNNYPQVTLYAIWSDNDKPVASISTTADLKKTAQKATLKCTDNAGIVSYYWGNSKPTASSTYTTVTSSKEMSVEKNVDSAGTYYLSCKDTNGNTSTSVKQIYYSYTVINMLETATGKEGTYTTNNYDQKTTNTYLAPDGTTLTLASIYRKPNYSSTNRFAGVSVGTPTTTTATVNKTAPELTANSTYTMWFNRNRVAFRYIPTGGTLEPQTTGTDGTKYTWSTNSNGYITRSDNGGTANALVTRLRYGATKIDLKNYNYSAGLLIKKQGYVGKKGAEWICDSGCTKNGITISQATDTPVSTNDFCDLQDSECTVVIKVNWTLASYTLTADANGGAISNTSGWTIASDSKTATKSLNYNKTYGILPAPTRAGYTFDGWYTSSSDGEEVTKDTKMGTTSTTIYAHWKVKKVKVTFMRNRNASDTTYHTQTFTYGNPYNSETKTGNKFGYNLDGTPKWEQTGQFGTWNYAGYTLLGWSTDRNATEKQWNPYANVTNNFINNNSPEITLYAVWKEKGYVLTADANGGIIFEANGWTISADGKTATKNVLAGEKYGELPKATHNECQIIKGWYTSSSGGKEVTNSTKMDSKNITIYAHWQQSCWRVGFPDVVSCQSDNGGGAGAYYEDGYCWIARDTCPYGWQDSCHAPKGNYIHCGTSSENACTWTPTCSGYIYCK